jgi:hypothetical protein
VVEVRVGDDDHQRERGDGADGPGQLGALPCVAAGVDDERAPVAEHQAGGEVQLRVPAGQHAVADLDPPSVGRAPHLTEPDREGASGVRADDDADGRPASASPARSALAASRVASRAVALIAVRPA